MENSTVNTKTDQGTGSSSPKAPSYPKLKPRTPKSVGPIEYIEERFNGSIAWYDKEAGRSKTKFMRLRIITVVGGALVPVLINIEMPYLTVVTTIISLLVLLAVSVDSVYHYGEQWSSYRSTEQFLRREYYLFTVNEGPYRFLDQDLSFQLFVERVEEAIAAENSSTLRVLATVSETKNTADKKGSNNSVLIPTENIKGEAPKNADNSGHSAAT